LGGGGEGLELLLKGGLKVKFGPFLRGQEKGLLPNFSLRKVPLVGGGRLRGRDSERGIARLSRDGKRPVWGCTGGSCVRFRVSAEGAKRKKVQRKQQHNEGVKEGAEFVKRRKKSKRKNGDTRHNGIENMTRNARVGELLSKRKVAYQDGLRKEKRGTVSCLGHDGKKKTSGWGNAEASQSKKKTG